MIVDANVLLYAVDATSRFHDPARDWLESALNGQSRIGLPWISLTAFQRIVTHPRASENPLTPAEAWSFVTDWLGAAQTWIPEPGARYSEIFGNLLVGHDLRGNLVTDAMLAALAMENGVGICSFDSDFARFDQIRWHRPVAP